MRDCCERCGVKYRADLSQFVDGNTEILADAAVRIPPMQPNLN